MGSEMCIRDRRRTPHRSTRCTATDTAADIESIEPTSEAIRSGTATSAHSSKPPAAVSSAINAAVAAAVATASASWVRRVTRPSYMCIIMAQATDSCKPRNPNGDNYFRGFTHSCTVVKIERWQSPNLRLALLPQGWLRVTEVSQRSTRTKNGADGSKVGKRG